jgi:hypothetical protein
MRLAAVVLFSVVGALRGEIFDFGFFTFNNCFDSRSRAARSNSAQGGRIAMPVRGHRGRGLSDGYHSEAARGVISTTKSA